MSLWIKETKVTISRIEEKGNIKKCTIRTSEKDQSGEWQSMFWNGILVGKAKEKVYGDKVKATIISGKVSNSKYNDKTYTNIVIFDVEVTGAETKEEWIPVETDEDSLPF